MSIAFRWSTNVGKNSDKQGTASQREHVLHRLRQFERVSNVDMVTLADGSVMEVRRASLVAAKDLLAAQKAAERRVAGRQAALRQLLAVENSSDDTRGTPLMAGSR